MILKIFDFIQFYSLKLSLFNKKIFILYGDNVFQIDFICKKLLKLFSKFHLKLYNYENILKKYNIIKYNKKYQIIIIEDVKKITYSFLNKLKNIDILILKCKKFQRNDAISKKFLNKIIVIFCYKLNYKQLQIYINNFIFYNKIIIKNNNIFIYILSLISNNFIVVNNELIKIKLYLKSDINYIYIKSYYIHNFYIYFFNFILLYYFYPSLFKLIIFFNKHKNLLKFIINIQSYLYSIILIKEKKKYNYFEEYLNEIIFLSLERKKTFLFFDYYYNKYYYNILKIYNLYF